MDARDEARKVIIESNDGLAVLLTDFFNSISEGRLSVPEYYYYDMAREVSISNVSLRGADELFRIVIDTIREHHGDLYVDELKDIKPLFEGIIEYMDSRFLGVSKVGGYKKENNQPKI